MINKVKVSVTVSSDLDTTIRQRAKDLKVSYSSLVEEYVAFAIFTKEQQYADELLGPKLQTTIRKEVRAMADRMAHFLSRAALESSNCKQLVFQLVVKEFGEERAFAFRDHARQASIDDLKKPLSLLEEMIKSSED